MISLIGPKPYLIRTDPTLVWFAIANGIRNAVEAVAIAEREGLTEPNLSRLASPWHIDADLGRPIEVVTGISKSRRLGFMVYQSTDDAFCALFERLRADRLIP